MAPETKRTFYRLLVAEVSLVLLSLLPWAFVLTIPIYTILATQFFFLRLPFWQKAAASFGPIAAWTIWLNI